MEQKQTWYIDRPEISALLDEGVAEIRAAGVEPTPQDIVWLYALSRDVVLCESTEADPYLSPPIYAAGMFFWPLTIQAEMWIERYPSQWWPDNELMMGLATAYAMIHSAPDSDREAFTTMTSKVRAAVYLNTWAFMRVSISIDTLKWLCKRIIGGSNSVEVDSTGYTAPIKKMPSSRQWGSLIAKMCNLYPSMTPEMVLSMPASQCLDLLKHGNGINSDTTIDQDHEANEKNRNDVVLFGRYRLAIKHIIQSGKDKLDQPGSAQAEESHHGQ